MGRGGGGSGYVEVRLEFRQLNAFPVTDYINKQLLLKYIPKIEDKAISARNVMIINALIILSSM